MAQIPPYHPAVKINNDDDDDDDDDDDIDDEDDDDNDDDGDDYDKNTGALPPYITPVMESMLFLAPPLFLPSPIHDQPSSS